MKVLLVTVYMSCGINGNGDGGDGGDDVDFFDETEDFVNGFCLAVRLSVRFDSISLTDKRL